AGACSATPRSPASWKRVSHQAAKARPARATQCVARSWPSGIPPREDGPVGSHQAFAHSAGSPIPAVARHYTQREVDEMLERLSRGLTFIAGSVVGGLALAFVIVALRPDLIRGNAGSRMEPSSVPQPISSAPARGGPERVTYAAAVQRAAPAVVNIYTGREVVERVDPSPFGEFFGNLLPFYKKRYERSLGSGVIVDESGHIVTNYHVVANAGDIRVQLADGRVATPQVVGVDPDTDLAVLKVDLSNLPVIA